MRNITRGVEEFGHKLFVDSLFSSPILFDMHTTKIKIYSVHPKCKGIPCKSGCKTVQVIRVTNKPNQGRLDYEGMEEKERTKYTNVHHSQVEGNVKDKSHSHKAYHYYKRKTHMANRMTGSYSMN